MFSLINHIENYSAKARFPFYLVVYEVTFG